jgi:hypothetical protein
VASAASEAQRTLRLRLTRFLDPVGKQAQRLIDTVALLDPPWIPMPIHQVSLGEAIAHLAKLKCTRQQQSSHV